MVLTQAQASCIVEKAFQIMFCFLGRRFVSGVGRKLMWKESHITLGSFCMAQTHIDVAKIVRQYEKFVKVTQIKPILDLDLEAGFVEGGCFLQVGYTSATDTLQVINKPQIEKNSGT